jgi:hypothetical protein
MLNQGVKRTMLSLKSVEEKASLPFPGFWCCWHSLAYRCSNANSALLVPFSSVPLPLGLFPFSNKDTNHTGLNVHPNPL